MQTVKSLALSAMIAVGAAGTVPAQDAPAADPDTVVATVGDTEITLGHMITMRQQLPSQYDDAPDAQLFPAILEQLIQQVVLVDTVTEVPRATQLRLDVETRALLAGVKIAEFAEQDVPEDEIRAVYDAVYADFQPETEYSASHILVATEAEAEAIVEELNGGADFATLAAERSTGPSGPNGGSLGWFGAGQMVEPFEAAVLALEEGEISGPVETRFGWHVIRLDGTRDTEPPAYATVRDGIAQQVLRERVQQSILAAVEAADVTRPDLSAIDPSVLSDPTLIE